MREGSFIQPGKPSQNAYAFQFFRERPNYLCQKRTISIIWEKNSDENAKVRFPEPFINAYSANDGELKMENIVKRKKTAQDDIEDFDAYVIKQYRKHERRKAQQNAAAVPGILLLMMAGLLAAIADTEFSPSDPMVRGAAEGTHFGILSQGIFPSSEPEHYEDVVSRTLEKHLKHPEILRGPLEAGNLGHLTGASFHTSRNAARGSIRLKARLRGREEPLEDREHMFPATNPTVPPWVIAKLDECLDSAGVPGYKKTQSEYQTVRDYLRADSADLLAKELGKDRASTKKKALQKYWKELCPDIVVAFP